MARSLHFLGSQTEIDDKIRQQSLSESYTNSIDLPRQQAGKTLEVRHDRWGNKYFAKSDSAQAPSTKEKL